MNLSRALRLLVPSSLILLGASRAPESTPPAQCQQTSTRRFGSNDNFQAPEPAPTLSPPLAAYMASMAPAQGYDGIGGDRPFGATFRVGGNLCSVVVQLRLRRSTGYGNDGISIGRAPFTTYVFHNAPVWPASSTSPQVLTIPLPVAAVQAYINTQPAPAIDVFIQDDTNVDWIQVTHTYN